MPASEKMKGLKVVGAGLPRSSTLSLKFALEQLGFDPCYHVKSHVLPFPEQVGPEWTRISSELDKSKRQKMLRSVYEGHPLYDDCVAACDGPTCFFIDDFLEMYPGVKIVCTVRDSPELWHKSYMNSVGRAIGRPVIYWLGWWVTAWVNIFYFNDGFNELVKRRYGVDSRDVEVYNKHLNWVKNVVPKDQLLIHNAKEGWEPLCKFLNVPVPDGPYPRVNDTESVGKILEGFIKEGLKRWAIFFGTVGAVGAAYWWKSL